MGIIGNYVMWRLPPNSSRNQAKLRRSVVRSFESYLEPGIRPIQGTLAGEIRLAFEPPSERSCSHDECELGWTDLIIFFGAALALWVVSEILFKRRK